MAHVEFKYTAGHTRKMLERDAKILSKLGKGSYLTRDLAAYRPVLLQEAMPPEPLQPVPEQEEEEDVDSVGDAWDEAIHVSTKLKNADGTWRKRPGAKSALE